MMRPPPMPRDRGRYDPAEPTNADLDRRLQNVERVLLSLQAQMTPKWMRVGGWTTIVGAVLGAAAKVWLGE